jgi:hypothetical protein
MVIHGLAPFMTLGQAGRAVRSHRPDLGQRLNAVVKTDFLGDLAVLNTQHRSPGEVHLPAGCRRQRAHQEVAEGRTGVRTAAFPLADDIVAFCDQIRHTPEVEIGECCAKIGHECLDVVRAAARLVQRILQEHVRRGELIDDAEIAGLSPELGEPPANDGLVILCFAHLDVLLVCVAKPPITIDDMPGG